MNPPAVSPSPQLLARFSTIRQLQLTKSGLPERRFLSVLRGPRIGLRISHGASSTRTVSESLGAESSRAWVDKPEFRRPCQSSAVTGTVPAGAPRYTPRQNPPVHSPLRWNSKSYGSNNTALLRPHHLPATTAPRALFSSAAMAATKIDGTAIARKVREQLQAEIAEKKGINPRFQPCLKIIQGECCIPHYPAASNQYL